MTPVPLSSRLEHPRNFCPELLRPVALGQEAAEGTAMLTVMFGFGLMMSVYIHRDTRMGRFGEVDD